MYLYLHIPKTGGQTVAERIGSAFPPERAYFLADTLRGPHQVEELAGRFDFVEAHVAAGSLREASGDIRIMCTVRDPVEQVISHYRHIRREKLLRLHRAATILSPAAFFEHHGDFMFNFQTRSLVRPFQIPSIETRLQSESRWLLDRLGPAFDRIDWIVPTESIDEFCQLWSIEQGIHLPLLDISRNRSAPDNVDQQRLREIVSHNSERLGLDLVAWSMAREAYATWRRRLLDSERLGLRRLTNAMCTWRSDGGSEIRLGHGWYPRAERSDGVCEWWAGPTTTSEIAVTNAAGERHLEFEVAVLLGIAPEQIRFFDAATLRPLPRSHEQTPGESVIRCRATLPAATGPHRIVVAVPNVRSAIEVVEGATDPTRRSFASQNWRLVA